MEELDVPEEQYMNERALMLIVKVLDGYTEPPGVDWPEHEKEEIAFSHWALDEALGLVWDHPWTLASETIENFAFKLEMYAAMSDTKSQKRVFSVAAETMKELLEDVREVER